MSQFDTMVPGLEEDTSWPGPSQTPEQALAAVQAKMGNVPSSLPPTNMPMTYGELASTVVGPNPLAGLGNFLTSDILPRQTPMGGSVAFPTAAPIPSQAYAEPVVEGGLPGSALPQERSLAGISSPRNSNKSTVESSAMPGSPELDASTNAARNAILATGTAAQPTQEQKDLLKEQADVEASKADAYAEEQKRLQASNEKIDAQIEAVKSDIAQRRAAYEAADPKTFWAKADTGDKIGMSIAIMLGGIAGRGNGNVALETLNKAMEQDWVAQQAKLARQLKVMELRGADIDALNAARDRAKNDFAAYRMASLGQVQSKIDSLIPKLKSADMVQKANEMKADAAKSAAEFDQGYMEKRAGTIRNTVETENKAQNPVVAGSGELPFGASLVANGKVLTESQGDSAQVLQINEPLVKNLEAIEASLSPQERQALERAGTLAYKMAKVHETPVVGGAADAAMSLSGSDIADIYNRALPGGLGQKYYQALNSLARDQVRNESGAAIGKDEFSTTLQKYSPMQTNDLATTQQTRRRLLDAHQAKLGDYSRDLFFRKKAPSK